MATSSAAPDQATGAIQVLSRAISVLRALRAEPDGLSLSQLSERTGLPRSTVHRLVTALEVEDFVAAASPTGRVRLGPDVLRLGDGGRRDLRAVLRPVMERIFGDVDETVDLAVLEGDRVRFIDQIPAPHRLRAVSAVGAMFPLHCTANGKAILALLTDREAVALLPGRLQRYTPNTITQRRALLRELAQIRDSGVALDREEHTLGISAAGFAVRDAGGQIAAITVPMPTQRFAGREREIVALLSEVRRDLLDTG